MIRARAPELAASGRYATLIALIEQLAASDLERDPWLLYWRGLARSSSAPIEARANLESAYGGFDAANDSTGLYLAWTAIVESYFAEYRSYVPVDRWISVFAALQERYPRFPSSQVALFGQRL